MFWKVCNICIDLETFYGLSYSCRLDPSSIHENDGSSSEMLISFVLCSGVHALL